MMPTALVIFSGIRFCYEALDRAVAWAQNNQAALQALFVQDAPVEEGYVYPSDINAAAALTDEADARQDDEQLLQSKIKLVRDKAAAADIDCSIQINNNPSLDDILAVAVKADIIFVDAGLNVDGEGAAGQLFDPGELAQKAGRPVELIEAE